MRPSDFLLGRLCRLNIWLGGREKSHGQLMASQPSLKDAVRKEARRLLDRDDFNSDSGEQRVFRGTVNLPQNVAVTRPLQRGNLNLMVPLYLQSRCLVRS